MLKPEEVRGILLPDAYIKAHGVSEYSLPEEYYYDEDGVYHYDRKFDKPMEEGGKPFNGVSFETYEDSDQIGFYIEYKDGYHFGNHAGFYENGALSFYTRMDEKEYYTYEWYENGALKRLMEYCKVHGQYLRSRESEWYENGVRKKTTEWRYEREKTLCHIREYEWYENGVLKMFTDWRRKDEQVLKHIKEYDENGKLIRKCSD